jgi:hypothetical protein
MPWAKFDDRYPWHRKVRPLSDAAFRLDVSSVCWCSENLTDGVIERAHLTLLSDVKRPVKAASELVAQGRWHEGEHDCESCPQGPANGYVIHDFLAFNPSRHKVEEEREKRRKAGEMGGRASGQSRANAKQSASALLSKTEAPVASSPTNPRTRTPSPSDYLEGGSHVPNASDTPPLFPNHCRQHSAVAEPGPCGGCADVRKANAAKPRLSVVARTPAKVPHCGQCDETRHRETEFGVIRCPECHPEADQEIAS